MAEQWPIFICYRQSDGMPTARRLYELLRHQRLPVIAETAEATEPPELDVYFDQAAPGVADWKSIHEPYLKRARAMLVICTPGAKLNEGPDDWVHKEIDWWLSSRDMAPLLVDPLGEGSRYVPEAIAKRWPDAQRIRIIEHEWLTFEPDELKSANERVTAQIIGGIVPSGKSFFRQEFEAEQKRAAELRQALQRQQATSGRLTWAIVGLSAFLLAAIAAVVFAFIQTEAANTARDAAQQALIEVQQADLRNRLLTAQQYLAQHDYADAIATAAALRVEAAKPDSPIADARRTLDSVLVRAVNSMTTPASCPGPSGDLVLALFSPDGKALLAGYSDQTIVRWDTADCRTAIPVFKHDDNLAGAAWAVDGAFATASWDRVIRLERAGEATIGKLEGGRGRIAGILFPPPSGDLDVLTAGGDVFTLSPSGQGFGQKPVALPEGKAVAFAGSAVFIAGADDSTSLFDLPSGVRLGPFKISARNVTAIAVLHDGRYLIAGADHTLWLAGPADALIRLGAQAENIEAVTVAPDDSVAASFTDAEIALWPLSAEAGQPRTLRPFVDDINGAIALSTDLLLASSQNGDVRLLSRDQTEPVWDINGNRYSRYPPIATADGTLVAIPGADGGFTLRPLVLTAESALAHYCSTMADPKNPPDFCVAN